MLMLRNRIRKRTSPEQDEDPIPLYPGFGPQSGASLKKYCNDRFEVSSAGLEANPIYQLTPPTPFIAA
jgi:hypothetical protein